MGSGQSAFDRRTEHNLETHILVRAQTVHVSARDISVNLDTFEWSPSQRFPFQLVHVSGLLLIVACTTLTDYTRVNPSRPKSTQSTQVNPIDPIDPSRPKSTQ
ncbi:hypothetical protein DPMN_174999 [Dreissena polymorpha]|uniref:Uncharacterized protein n=1 Tax=Dreissena polymorpha TaxID=45954 RepID=A0A9D4E4C9_DREPO|nr:hypothetical protein DPMN_174999 [Dreissena polymorpha]